MAVQSVNYDSRPNAVWSLSMLSTQINYVQKQVEKVNITKQSEMDELEVKKRKLKQAAGSDMPAGLLEQHINKIMTNHTHYLDEVNKLTAEAIEQKRSIDLLDTAVTMLDREIARVQADRDKAVVDLQEKKEKLKSKLDSIVELNEMIAELESKKVLATEYYNKEMEETDAFKTELYQRTDLDEDELQFKLKEIDARMEGIGRKFAQDIEFMKKQITDLEIESIAIMQSVDEALNERFVGDTEDYLEEIKRLEYLKLQASPSNQDAFDKSIAFYRTRITEDELQQGMTLKDKINEFLKQRNLHMSDTGEILDANGKILTKAIMQENGLQEELDRFLLEGSSLQYLDPNTVLTHDGRVLTKEKAQKITLLEKFDTLATLCTDESIRSDMSSRDSEFPSEDALYLKKYLGVPLTLALAEITAKQPRDPIHYLGHWLFKYRYNQEVEQYKKQEVDELTSMRNKIAKDKWNQFLQDEARKALLDIVHRAETQGDKNEYDRELQRIAEETEAMENEEDQDALEEEARDTLGEYNGPTVNQRRAPSAQK